MENAGASRDLVQHTEVCQYYGMTISHQQSNIAMDRDRHTRLITERMELPPSNLLNGKSSALSIPVFSGLHSLRPGNLPPGIPGTARRAI